MKKVKRIFLLVFILFLFFSITYSVNAASNFDLDKLNFDVKIKENGDMDIIEKWDIKINGETNTLFKSFEKNPKKYDNIENVKVKDLSIGKNFERLDNLMYHVTTDCFYAMDNDKGDFEIAWGINKSSGTKSYEISYTVKNVVTKYNDCSEIYWQLVGKDFEVPVNKVMATIKLPRSVEKKDDLRMWAHGPLNGEINMVSNDSVKIEISPFKADTFIEFRLGIKDLEMFLGSKKKVEKNKFEDIINEETILANDANRIRENIRRGEKNKRIIGNILLVLISLLYILKTIKNIKKIKNTPKLKPEINYDYFREIPNEKETPGNSAFIYFYNKNKIDNKIPNILSATMLDLSLKGYLSFEVNEGKTKEEQVKIILKDKNSNDLRKSESIFYNYLKMIGISFTMKDFEKFTQKDSAKFVKMIKEIIESIKEEAVEDKTYDKEKQNNKDNYIVFIYLTLFEILVGNTIIAIKLLGDFNKLSLITNILGFIYIISTIIFSKRISGLTQKGINEQNQWNGLKKYMEDFSLLDEKEVPELVLWEKYLVYATVFGIAEKVLKQLKAKYPQLSDEEYVKNTNYLYLTSNMNMNKSFTNTINSAIEKSYRQSIASTSSSSGEGYGGGFSSGGGGGGRRRPEAEADNYLI